MRGKVLVACGVALATPALPQSVTILHDFSGNGSLDNSGVNGISHGVQVGGYAEYVDPWTFTGGPVMWSGSAKSRVSLYPKGYDRAVVLGTNQGKHVGNVSLPGSPSRRATLWTGNGTEILDLHVASLGAYEFQSTFAEAIWGDGQVGYGETVGGQNRAIMWNGTSASAELLHPDHLGLSTSEAVATDGSQQVGSGRITNLRALLWSGTAASAVDLTPANATSANANGVAGGYQVGVARIGGINRAAVWSGTAASFIDLHPEGASASKIVATNGTWHVGSVTRNEDGLDFEHAVAWHSTTLEMFDLHTLLPEPYQMFPSWATSIDELGNIGGVFNSVGTSVYNSRAVIWTVPEPSTFIALGVGAIALLLSRRRR